MTKSELIASIHARFPTLTFKDVEFAINTILDEMGDTLAKNDRIEIRNFGSFKLNQRPARVGRNPKTGERVEVPPKATPHFKPGLELRFVVDKN